MTMYVVTLGYTRYIPGIYLSYDNHFHIPGIYLVYTSGRLRYIMILPMILGFEMSMISQTYDIICL